MKRYWKTLPLTLILPWSAWCHAQIQISTPSLDELLNLEITVASGDENRLTVRESPGVITVLTRREIDAIGASNLFELLRHVAGFQFGVNETGLQSLIVRGSYGGEGQIQINYNGVPINENSFGSTQFAGHYSLDHIERIEIIRGPGSALYGGAAELGVVNIISKQYLGTAQASVATNQTNDDTGYTTASIGAGIGDKSASDFSANFYVGFNRRDRTDTEYYDRTGMLLENASPFFEADSSFFQLITSTSDLDFKLLYAKDNQNYQINYLVPGTNNTTRAVDADTPGEITYSSIIAQLDYRYELLEYTTLNTSLFFGSYDSGQVVGEYTDTQYPDQYWDIPTQRLGIEFSLNERPLENEDLSLDIGYGFHRDTAKYSQLQVDTLFQFYGVDRTVGSDEFDTHYVFIQAMLRWADFAFTAGLRGEDHSQFGGVTVPRLGVTYVNGPRHFKVLASQAFKAPPVGTLGITPDIQPEEASVFEIEVGHLIGTHSLVQLNLFANALENVIAYDDSAVPFQNGGEINANGMELEYRLEQDWGFVAASFSRTWFQDVDVATYLAFSVDDSLNLNPIDRLLGAAEYKWTTYGQYRFTDKLSINSSLVYLGDRQSIGYIPELARSTYTQVDAELIANVNLRYENLMYEGLDVTVGLYNLTDADNIVTTGFFAEGVPHTEGIGRRANLKVDLTF